MLVGTDGKREPAYAKELRAPEPMRLKKDFILWRFEVVEDVVEVVEREMLDVDVERDDEPSVCVVLMAVGASSIVGSMLLRLESSFMSMSSVFDVVDGAIVCCYCSLKL